MVQQSSPPSENRETPATKVDPTPGQDEKKSQPVPSPAVKPSVLFVHTGHGTCDYEFARWLVRDGVEVNSRQKTDDLPLTWEEVKRYNVLVLAGIGLANADGTLTDQNRQNIATINRFLEAGGGVFFVPVWGQIDTGIPPQVEFLKPLGATPHFEEMVFDHDATVRATAWKIDFSYTSEVLPSPLTTKVSGLWIPVASRPGMGTSVAPFVADKAWQTVVTASRSSYTITVPTSMVGPTKEMTQGLFTERVPLVASRDVGKGRMVISAISPDWLWERYAGLTLEGVTLNRGLRGIPSDGYQLVLNSLFWLAQPSAGGELGGAKTAPEQLVSPFVTTFGKPFDWSQSSGATFPHLDNTWPGVIGARTALSGGKGSVGEWVAQAKKAGLKYLVFLEDFAELTEAELAKLKAECAKLTDADFAAIPGIRIRDEVGNHYFYASPLLLYPEKKLLSDDGKVFVAYDPAIEFKDPRAAKGQLSMTTLHYAYVLSGFKLLAGNFFVKGVSSPVANWFCNYDAVGVITRQGGHVVEDAMQEYLQTVGAGQTPLPIAVDLLDDPAELAGTPWRTVLRMSAGDQAQGGKLDGVNPVVSYFTKWHSYPDNPNRIFVTDGPEIDYWSMIGPRDYGGDNRGDFVWQNLRWRVGGKVRSEAGLKEVVIYDGDKIFRRFLPGGAKEFLVDLDLTHDRQHNLVMIATDNAGHRAIGQELIDRNHRLQENNCADRNNQLSYGYSTRTADNTGITLGGNLPLATPNKRVIDPSISPSGAFKNDSLLGAPAFDGTAVGEPIVATPVSLQSKDGKGVGAPAIGKSERLMMTGDVNIGEGTCEYRFADNVATLNVWHSLWTPELSKDIVVAKRNHFFQIDPDSPIAVFLWRVRIGLKSDINTKAIDVGYIAMNEARLWAVRSSNGTVLSGYNEETPLSAGSYESHPFGLGSYAAALDSPLGGSVVFPLTDGLSVSWGTPQTSRIGFSLLGDDLPRKQGESRDVELLLVGIPRSTKYTRQFAPGTTQMVERFRSDFGLGEAGPNYKVALTSGAITSQRYLLRVDGTVGHAFSGVIEGKLISSLPIVVSGLNDHWSAVLYDRTLKAARPIGMFENQAWATVPVHGRADLFVGHPVTSDRREIVLQLTQTGPDRWHLEAHNPTDAPMTATLSCNPQFEPLAGKKLPVGAIAIPAGSSLGFDL